MLRRLALSFALFLAACGGDETPRCAQCGMTIETGSRWKAGLADSGGDERLFDAPKCLLRFRLRERGTRDPWVTEYYAQERRPLDRVLLVTGSDLVGPMGRDLVPVEGADAAARFAEDHGGRVVRPTDVNDALLREVDLQP